MNDASGEIEAWHYAWREPVRVVWRRETLVSVEPTVRSADLCWIAPALVDLQVNGFGGVDFQQPGLRREEMEQATLALLQAGCAGYFPTLITNRWELMLGQLRHLRQLRAESTLLQQTIAGWHLEGPFLSPEPGYHGAHDPALMVDPSVDQIRELRSAAGGDRILLTLAPERPGAEAAIREAVRWGITVSLGHTNASAEILAAARQAGACGFTHLGNACPQLLDRFDNILWRVLDDGGFVVGLIPDRWHVRPPLFRLIHRAQRPGSVYLTTDAMAAAGAPPGRYRVGPMWVEVGADRAVRQPGRTNFAGSALRPIEGVHHASVMLRRPWQEVWDMFASAPAALVGFDHGLRPGAPATFCVIDGNHTDPLGHVRVYLSGRRLEGPAG
jgi:N-acetylglucosamine-6-phosphate deacetylase